MWAGAGVPRGLWGQFLCFKGLEPSHGKKYFLTSAFPGPRISPEPGQGYEGTGLPPHPRSLPAVDKMGPTPTWGDSRALGLKVSPSSWPGVACDRKSSALVSPQP